jgi:hypothetical protein
MDVAWPDDEELVSKLKELKANPSHMAASQVEYWQIAGKTLINRIVTN